MISLISRNDWANVGYEYAKALKSIGVEAEAYSWNKHALAYPEQAKRIKSIYQLEHILGNTDILIHMHSKQCELPDKTKTYSSYGVKKNFVFHGGSIYRINYESINKIFNPFVDGSIIQTYDLWNLGAIKKHWILPPIDTEALKPNPNEIKHEVLIFAHYPSWSNKGSIKIINPTMEKIKKQYGDSIIYKYQSWETRVLHDENMKRMLDTDVYIESIYEPELKCGEWGVTALESAALGKITITNFGAYKEYFKEYGYCPLLVAGNAEELELQVTKLLQMSKGEIENQKIATRKWVEEFHNYKAIGNRLAKALGI